MRVKCSLKDYVRLWRKVDKQRSSIFYNGTRCWEWTAACNKQGYGIIGIGVKTHLAHRIAFQMEFGEIQSGLFVLHHCDNSLCCNPSHLFLGTQKDNMDDMQSKGRKVVSVMAGEKNGFSKLSDSQVAEIRQRYSTGTVSQRALGREFGVSKTHIRRIVNYVSRSS